MRFTAIDDLDEDEDILDSAELHTRLYLRMEEDDEAGVWEEFIERARNRSHDGPLNHSLGEGGNDSLDEDDNDSLDDHEDGNDGLDKDSNDGLDEDGTDGLDEGGNKPKFKFEKGDRLWEIGCKVGLIVVHVSRTNAKWLCADRT